MMTVLGVEASVADLDTNAREVCVSELHQYVAEAVTPLERAVRRIGFPHRGGTEITVENWQPEDVELVAARAREALDAGDYAEALSWLEDLARTQWFLYEGGTLAPPAPPPVPKDGFFVYRLWGEADRLLYVGSSRRLRYRLASHYRRWGHLIQSVTWVEYEDASAMILAERAAIRHEQPSLNKQGRR